MKTFIKNSAVLIAATAVIAVIAYAVIELL